MRTNTSTGRTVLNVARVVTALLLLVTGPAITWAQEAPGIAQPPPGSTLTTSAVAFRGTKADAATQYYIFVGTSPGQTNLFTRSLGTTPEVTVTGLPETGTIFVRYWTRFDLRWEFQDHQD